MFFGHLRLLIFSQLFSQKIRLLNFSQSSGWLQFVTIIDGFITFTKRQKNRADFFRLYFLEADRFALGGEKHRRISGFLPRLGVLGVIINEDARFADEVNLFTMTDNADEVLGIHLGDVFGKPVNLASLAVLIRRLSEDVDLLALGDEVLHRVHVLGKRFEVRHRGAAQRRALIGGVSLVEVSEDAVHVEVVGVHCGVSLRVFLTLL